MKKAGFRARSSNGSRWERPVDERRVVVLLFQCDKNGWDWDGNRFTLNLFVIDLQTKNVPLAQCRFGKLINEVDGEVWLALTNRVIAKLQHVKQPPLYDWEYPEDRARLLEPKTWFSAESDPWMRFYDEDDLIAWWVEFLEPRMDKMIERLLSR